MFGSVSADDWRTSAKCRISIVIFHDLLWCDLVDVVSGLRHKQNAMLTVKLDTVFDIKSEQVLEYSKDFG